MQFLFDKRTISDRHKGINPTVLDSSFYIALYRVSTLNGVQLVVPKQLVIDELFQVQNCLNEVKRYF